MAITVVDFDEPDISPGPLLRVTRGPVTVHFENSEVIAPTVATHSPPHGLRKRRQSEETEQSFHLVMTFSHLQRRVRLFVGMTDEDITVPSVEAQLRAFDGNGRELVPRSSKVSLGQLPRAIATPLEIRANGDVIERVELCYSGATARKVIDSLELEAVALVPAARDTAPPVVRIDRPSERQAVSSRVVEVQGHIDDRSRLSAVVVNGVTVPAHRWSREQYRFRTEVTLPEDSDLIRAEATDEHGLSGWDERRVDVRTPTSIDVADVQFTQTGLLDIGVPFPSRLVAGKTSLFRVTLRIQSADGRPASVDGASILHKGTMVRQGDNLTVPIHEFWPGAKSQGTHLVAPTGRSSNFSDGDRVYFVVPGQWLSPSSPHRFTLRLHVRGNVVFERVLASNRVFRSIRGISMLAVPQHRPFDYAHTRALSVALAHMARMYPVPDGLSALDDAAPRVIAGIRFAITAPLSYQDHTDPADDAAIPYEQGFLLHDHQVANGSGADLTFGTTDDPSMFWAGEFLPINFTWAEDADRSGVFDEMEMARVRRREDDSTTRTRAHDRIDNWSSWVRSRSGSVRQAWNRDRTFALDRQARRAIAVLSGGGSAPQNRTGWKGNAGAGETSFWADIDGPLPDDAGPPGMPGAYLAHEVGHTYGLSHPDGVPAGTCMLPGEAVNLLTRQFVTNPTDLLCSGVPGSDQTFLHPRDYDRVFDQIAVRGVD